MKESNLSDRMRTLIRMKLPRRGQYLWLQQQTGIERHKWSSWANDRQRPNAEMIEAIANLWPEYTCWLLLGRTGVPQIDEKAALVIEKNLIKVKVIEHIDEADYEGLQKMADTLKSKDGDQAD